MHEKYVCMCTEHFGQALSHACCMSWVGTKPGSGLDYGLDYLLSFGLGNRTHKHQDNVLGEK